MKLLKLIEIDNTSYDSEVINIINKFHKRIKNPDNYLTAEIFDKLLLNDIFYLRNREILFNKGEK